MTTKSMVESTWAEDMGQFLYHLDLDTRKITRRLEKLQLKIINSVPSSLIKLVLIVTYCLDIHSSIYIYIYIYIILKTLIHKNILPTDPNKKIKLIIYYNKFKTSNLVIRNNSSPSIGVLQKTNVIYKFKCPLGDCISDNNNI